MTNRQITLADLLERAKTRLGVTSGRALAARAEADGFDLTHTQINYILKGTYKHAPTRKTLEAIAHLSGAPLTVVYRAAGIAAVPGGRFADEMPDDADLLTKRQRAIVLSLIREMAGGERQMREHIARSHPEWYDTLATRERSDEGASRDLAIVDLAAEGQATGFDDRIVVLPAGHVREADFVRGDDVDALARAARLGPLQNLPSDETRDRRVAVLARAALRAERERRTADSAVLTALGVDIVGEQRFVETMALIDGLYTPEAPDWQSRRRQLREDEIHEPIAAYANPHPTEAELGDGDLVVQHVRKTTPREPRVRRDDGDAADDE